MQAILSLGNLYVSGFVESPEETERCVQAPLDLVLCLQCYLLQLRHTVNPGLLYRQYWYLSMVNSTMRAALADITQSAEQLTGVRAGDVVLDIGANDGTLLRSYRTPGLQLMGYEPAKNLVTAARGGTTMVFNALFQAEPFLQASSTLATIITSIAMFYDLEDPNRFVQDIARCLAPDGLWIIQMAYLPAMLSQNAFDNICHEHLEYYSLAALTPLMQRHGFKVVDVQLNDVNGGSIRIYVAPVACTRYDGEGRDRVRTLEQQERALQLERVETYQAFAGCVQGLRETTRRFVQEVVARGQRVYAYGASTKGNTLLQYYGLDHTLVQAAAERSQDKWGKQTAGTWIPIVSEQQMRQERPDYLLILPWHFLPEFLERERAYLAAGGRFIVPLPQFRVLP